MSSSIGRMEKPLRRLRAKPLGIDLWLADLDSLPSEPGVWLSPPEHARADRFVFERDRQRYMAAHRLLRQLLADHYGVPAAVPFNIGVNEKPHLGAAAPCSFNLSHSERWALIGLRSGTAEIGVDIECLRPIDGIDALAAQNFVPAERAELRHIALAGRLRAFLRGWTRKEACLKAVGSGLSVAPQSFETGLAPRAHTTWLNHEGRAHRVRIESLRLGATLAAAVACVDDALSEPGLGKSLTILG